MEYARITAIGVLFITMTVLPRISWGGTLYCGQDLDNDGKVTGEAETAQCVGADSSFCPVGAVQCTEEQNVASCCSEGSYNATLNRCETARAASCPSGFSYDSSRNVCVKAPACGSGSWYSSPWKSCIKSAYSGSYYSCPYNDGSYRPCEYASWLDYSVQVWQWGTACGNYPDGTVAWCNLTTYYYCDGGFGLSGTTCYTAPSCSPGYFNGATDTCDTGVTQGCPAGFSYDSTSGVCYKAAACQSTRKCPFDPARPCTDISGEFKCSPNQCFDPQASGAAQEVVVPNDSTMLVDDGARDAAGNCLDQIYIFTGRSMTCQTSGVDSGWQNCCMTSEAPLKDSLGNASTVMGGLSTIKHVYHLAQVAYYGNIILNGTSGVDIGGLSTAVFDAVNTVNQTGSMMAGFQSYAAATFLNPASIAFSAALYLAQEMLLSGSCSQEDLETAMMDSSGRCHYINSYCKKKWPLIGCVQEVDVFCCFNSKLARIVHEQGRPQLKTFNPLWGSDDGPGNCRGFTASEFQMLDFARMNLSEYFGEITTKAQNTIEQQVGTKINQYFNRTR